MSFRTGSVISGATRPLCPSNDRVLLGERELYAGYREYRNGCYAEWLDSSWRIDALGKSDEGQGRRGAFQGTTLYCCRVCGPASSRPSRPLAAVRFRNVDLHPASVAHGRGRGCARSPGLCSRLGAIERRFRQ